MEPMQAEPEWLAQRSVRGPLREARETLDACRERLGGEEVKMPLNVACSDVLCGVFTRAGERVRVAGHAHFHHHKFDVQDVVVPLPQIALLRAALERAAVELAALAPASAAAAVLARAEAAAAALELARRQLATPERALRFPQRFFALGPHVPPGYCGELFACDEHDLVFNLHAYQDRGPTFVATDSVSVKGTDPQLRELWRALDARVLPGLQRVIAQLRAALA